MALDEYIINFVLEILKNEHVSNQLYDIVNRSSQPDRSQIINENQIGLQNTIEALEREKGESAKSCSDKNFELKQKDKEIQECREKIEELSQKLSANNEKTDLLNEPWKAYEIYKSLPKELRDKSLNFISENSIFAFIVTGVIYLERFWDFIKEELLANRTEYVERLKDIFDFFFDMRNDAGQPYVRNKCKIGDDYKYDRHIMVHGGQNLGVVSEILFLGFCDSNGKIIKKTIVRVKDN